MTQMIGWLWVVLAITGLAGCDKPHYPPKDRPTLYTTISADGQMVAALDRIGTDRARLRVKNLKTEKNWVEIPVPPYTTSIRFGLEGHELLLTHHIGEFDLADLSKWNLDKPEDGIQRIYQAYGLGFPMETAPGEYLVRSCVPNVEKKCHSAVGVWWDWVRNGRLVHQFTAQVAMNYSQPNVVQGQGFFWRQVGGLAGKEDPHPSILSVPFPGKTAPVFDTSQFDKDETNDFVCDYKSARCLRLYVANWKQKGPHNFIYANDVLFGSARCAIPGVSGYFDEISLSPNGNAAVMSVADSYDQPRHVVVLQFKPGQCEPTSIQHIDFEEK